MDQVRDEWIKARVTHEEKERAERIAASEGLDLSGLIRRRVFGGAEERISASLFDFDEDDVEVRIS